ncbi:MAG: hypothetical protein A2X81_18480 [Desulfobacterales bacterium GWB2_56_26]|nr:MAG: hypothetical protein A2X81_18480 [Desulfobacterales bacterium GWB2_56_26]
MQGIMTNEIEQIRHRLKQLEEEIAETLRRLPAHSVKPPVMIDLLELEDERDLLLKRLKELA